jgi:predicted Rossmann fold flavoprotein
MKNEVNIVIIGAGASGLMLATLMQSKDILVVEKNSKIGAKILVSGGGKCNVTNGNLSSKNFLGNQRFIKNIIKRFDQDKLVHWLNEKSLHLIVRKKNQYFCEHSAKELVDLFAKEIHSDSLSLNTNVEDIKVTDDGFDVITNKGKVKAKKVVVATGGLSFPKLGACDFGYKVAESFGHRVSALSAGLVGLTVQPEQFFFKTLSGSSINVKITVNYKHIEGALLFAHKGITGPAVLDASLYWEKGKIEIDFLPTIHLNSLRTSKKHISRLLGLPSRVAKTFLSELQIEDKAAVKLTPEEWEKLDRLKSYSFAPAGTFGYSKAEVTKGGVIIDEIDSSSMMSKKVNNLYFLGEVLDVTGELGGYNFQWAFSSAYVCAKGLE